MNNLFVVFVLLGSSAVIDGRSSAISQGRFNSLLKMKTTELIPLIETLALKNSQSQVQSNLHKLLQLILDGDSSLPRKESIINSQSFIIASSLHSINPEQYIHCQLYDFLFGTLFHYPALQKTHMLLGLLLYWWNNILYDSKKMDNAINNFCLSMITINKLDASKKVTIGVSNSHRLFNSVYRSIVALLEHANEFIYLQDKNDEYKKEFMKQTAQVNQHFWKRAMMLQQYIHLLSNKQRATMYTKIYDACGLYAMDKKACTSILNAISDTRFKLYPNVFGTCKYTNSTLLKKLEQLKREFNKEHERMLVSCTDEVEQQFTTTQSKAKFNKSKNRSSVVGFDKILKQCTDDKTFAKDASKSDPGLYRYLRYGECKQLSLNCVRKIWNANMSVVDNFDLRHTYSSYTQVYGINDDVVHSIRNNVCPLVLYAMLSDYEYVIPKNARKDGVNKIAAVFKVNDNNNNNDTNNNCNSSSNNNNNNKNKPVVNKWEPIPRELLDNVFDEWLKNNITRARMNGQMVRDICFFFGQYKQCASDNDKKCIMLDKDAAKQACHAKFVLNLIESEVSTSVDALQQEQDQYHEMTQNVKNINKSVTTKSNEVVWNEKRQLSVETLEKYLYSNGCLYNADVVACANNLQKFDQFEMCWTKNGSTSSKQYLGRFVKMHGLNRMDVNTESQVGHSHLANALRNASNGDAPGLFGYNKSNLQSMIVNDGVNGEDNSSDSEVLKNANCNNWSKIFAERENPKGVVLSLLNFLKDNLTMTTGLTAAVGAKRKDEALSSFTICCENISEFVKPEWNMLQDTIEATMKTPLNGDVIDTLLKVINYTLARVSNENWLYYSMNVVELVYCLITLPLEGQEEPIKLRYVVHVLLNMYIFLDIIFVV